VRGKKEKSDLDILVNFEEKANLSLLDFIRIENYLSERLGVKADLVERETLKPRTGKHILGELIEI